MSIPMHTCKTNDLMRKNSHLFCIQEEGGGKEVPEMGVRDQTFNNPSLFHPLCDQRLFRCFMLGRIFQQFRKIS